MGTFLQLLSAVGLVALGAAALYAAFKFDAFLRLLESGRVLIRIEREARSHCCLGPRNLAEGSGFAVYSWLDDRWVLTADLSAPGHEATPPSIPGTFVTQAVRTQSSARASARHGVALR
ncbi:MAG: hypothetical protein KF774_16610 [Planctomyces sp.]|nr:hypothetical protein [Planctomyces sp.]